MRAAWWCALALSVIAAAAGARAQPAAKCPQVIGPENAERLFAALKDFRGDDGCALEEVRTEGDVMRVEWRKGGVPVPLCEVRPAACGPGSTVSGPAFSLSAPAGAAERCPRAVGRMTSLIASETLGGPAWADAPSTFARWRGKLALLAGAGAALLAAAALASWRRRRRSSPR